MKYPKEEVIKDIKKSIEQTEETLALLKRLVIVIENGKIELTK